MAEAGPKFAEATVLMERGDFAAAALKFQEVLQTGAAGLHAEAAQGLADAQGKLRAGGLEQGKKTSENAGKKKGGWGLLERKRMERGRRRKVEMQLRLCRLHQHPHPHQCLRLQ